MDLWYLLSGKIQCLIVRVYPLYHTLASTAHTKLIAAEDLAGQGVPAECRSLSSIYIIGSTMLFLSVHQHLECSQPYVWDPQLNPACIFLVQHKLLLPTNTHCIFPALTLIDISNNGWTMPWWDIMHHDLIQYATLNASGGNTRMISPPYKTTLEWQW